MTPKLPSLAHVIAWLEAGCSVTDAVAELNLHERTLAALAQQAPRGSYTISGSRTVCTHQTPAQQAQEPVGRRCSSCGTHEVAIKLECQNSNCSAYADSVTIHEGWRTTPPAPPVPEPVEGGTLEENVRVLLDNTPGKFLVRDHQGGGPEDIRGSLSITWSKLLKAAEAAPSKPAPLAGEVTDEQIVSALESAGVRFLHIKNGVSGKKDCWTTLGCQDVHKITDGVRAILALRPQAVPMTDDQIVQGQEQQGAQSILSFMKGVRFVEAHHGITAKAEGGA